mmetsp:Transcript_63384/g.151274  ORF Transcript_63384/g.151274 Transcript_63384/m.151274 type:complete len:244 (-) Transcript_63384:64-795(-)
MAVLQAPLLHPRTLRRRMPACRYLPILLGIILALRHPLSIGFSAPIFPRSQLSGRGSSWRSRSTSQLSMALRGVAPARTQSVATDAEAVDDEQLDDEQSTLDVDEAREQLERWSNLPLIPVTSQDELDSVLQVAREARRLVLVDYYAPWCRVCRRLYQQLERLSKEDRFKDVAFAVVNFEQSRRFAKERGIQKLPTLEIWGDGVLQQTWSSGKRQPLVENILHQLDVAKGKQAQNATASWSAA